MGGIIALLFGAAFVWASAPNLNPKFKFTPSNPALEGRPGVLHVYKSDVGEVHLKIVPIADAKAAARAQEVGFGLIKGLYLPKKNPYAGEVTSLVQCDSRFAPKEFEIACPGGQKTKAIAGGAGARNAFGMCRKDDIQKVAAFFSCFDSKKNELLEVRLFLPFSDVRNWASSLKHAEQTAGELLQ